MTFENRNHSQQFEEWHNGTYRYVSYVKPKKSDIWRTVAWFLKLLLLPSKIEFYCKKLEQCIKRVTYVIKFFLKMEELTLRVKFETLREFFKPKLIFSLNLY